MKFTKEQLWSKAKDYFFIALGMALYGFGFSAFILPENVVIGGMAGVGSLIYFTTGIPVAISSLALNLTLLSIAYKIVGKEFVVGSLWGVAMASFFVGLFQPLFNGPIVNDTFMSLVIGGVFCGVGIGLCFIHNGSSGGTDIVAAIVTKYSNVSIGRVILMVDLCIISSSYFIFHRVDTIVYGLIVLIIYTYVADLIINTPRQAVQFTIFSSRWQEIADAVTSQAHRGCTVMDGIGWYSRKEVKVLLVMCRKIEAIGIYRMVKSIDKNAFITQANVNGVYGKGFDELKLRNKKKKGDKNKKETKPAHKQSDDGLPVFNERKTPPLDVDLGTTNPSGNRHI